MSVPKLRFPEFRDAGEWGKKILSNLSACGLSNGIFNGPKKVGSGYKLINVSDMYIESTINEGILSLIEISEDEFSRNKVENGDIFFTRSSLVKSGIAHSNIYLGHSSDVIFDGHLIRFRPNRKIVIPIFINYLLKTDHIRNQLVARGKTATMTTIGQSDVGGVNLSIPHIKEQQEIADCLSSIDHLITAETQKLNTLKAHKKGLMQQLFPALDEVKR
jgi:type I restriction enzyme, S subunit